MNAPLPYSPLHTIPEDRPMPDEIEAISAAKKSISAERTVAMKDIDWNASELANVEEVEPEEDEIAVIKARQEGHPDYQPYVSQEELLKELGL